VPRASEHRTSNACLHPKVRHCWSCDARARASYLTGIVSVRSAMSGALLPARIVSLASFVALSGTRTGPWKM
jgi:hypothetical protein